MLAGAAVGVVRVVGISVVSAVWSPVPIYMYIYIKEVKMLSHHDITKIKNIILPVLDVVLVDIEFDVDVTVVVVLVVVEAIIKILHVHRTI